METADDYFNAANVAELYGRYEEANAYYAKALAIRPDYPEVFFNRAGNWAELKEYGYAIKDYGRVIEYWPDNPSAHGELAEIYLSASDSAVRDKGLALFHARRACELDQFSRFDLISQLAAALAASGRYTDAIQAQQAAIKAAAEEIESDMWVGKLESQLFEYQVKQQEMQQGKSWFSWLNRSRM